MGEHRMTRLADTMRVVQADQAGTPLSAAADGGQR